MSRYCPECEGEFRPEIDVCPTCEVELVNDLDGVARPAPARLVSGTMLDLVGFVDEHEGRSARRRLRDAGFSAELVIRDAPGMERGPETVEEFWLRVPLERAREVAAFLGLQRAVDETCPKCGSEMQDETCPQCDR